MPLFLEPDQRFPIVLDSDKDKPIESRPTFFAKSQSMRSQLALSTAMDEALSHKTTQEIFDATCCLIADNITGWANMGAYTHGNDIKEFLSHGEARELLGKILSNQHVNPEEKKS
jgi:hypothetical protein